MCQRVVWFTNFLWVYDTASDPQRVAARVKFREYLMSQLFDANALNLNWRTQVRSKRPRDDWLGCYASSIELLITDAYVTAVPSISLWVAIPPLGVFKNSEYTGWNGFNLNELKRTIDRKKFSLQRRAYPEYDHD